MALAFGDFEILSDLGRDIRTTKIFFAFFGIRKRGEMHKKFFEFSTIQPIPILSVLNVKVNRAEITLC